MASQDVQLEIMETGGFDINLQEDNTPEFDWNDLDDITPEGLMIMREGVETRLSNPCTGCEHGNSTDPHVLDFCHYTCKDGDVEPVLLVDEVGCDDCKQVDCICEDATLSPLELQANYDKWNRLFGDAL